MVGLFLLIGHLHRLKMAEVMLGFNENHQTP